MLWSSGEATPTVECLGLSPDSVVTPGVGARQQSPVPGLQDLGSYQHGRRPGWSASLLVRPDSSLSVQQLGGLSLWMEDFLLCLSKKVKVT